MDGQVQAFTALGGVPTGMICYDSLRLAVIRVLLGRDRWEDQSNYDPVFLDWIFWWYLGTVELADRLLDGPRVTANTQSS